MGTRLIVFTARVALLAIIIGLNQVHAAGSEDDCEGPTAGCVATVSRSFFQPIWFFS